MHKGLLIILITFGLIGTGILGFFLLQSPTQQSTTTNTNGNTSTQFTACATDADCVLVNESCCSCENGGSKTCIQKDLQAEWERRLNCDAAQPYCITLYRCDSQPTSCDCIQNTCQPKTT